MSNSRIEALRLALEALRGVWQSNEAELLQFLQDGDHDGYYEHLFACTTSAWTDFKIAMRDSSETAVLEELSKQKTESLENLLLALFVEAYQRPDNNIVTWHMALTNYFRGDWRALLNHR